MLIWYFVSPSLLRSLAILIITIAQWEVDFSPECNIFTVQKKQRVIQDTGTLKPYALCYPRTSLNNHWIPKRPVQTRYAATPLILHDYVSPQLNETGLVVITTRQTTSNLMIKHGIPEYMVRKSLMLPTSDVMSPQHWSIDRLLW